MVTQLLTHERIKTTVPKAKALKQYADKVITMGKEGTLHARQRAGAIVRTDEVVEKLFSTIADRYKCVSLGRLREHRATFVAKRSWQDESTGSPGCAQSEAGSHRLFPASLFFLLSPQGASGRVHARDAVRVPHGRQCADGDHRARGPRGRDPARAARGRCGGALRQRRACSG